MPKYKKDIDYMSRDMDTSREYAAALLRSVDKTYSMRKSEHKAYIAMLYLTGARPEEIRLMQKSDIQITENYVMIRLKTLKRGMDRTLIFSNKTPFIDVILEHSDSCDMELFTMDLSTYKKMIYKVSQDNVTPYTFRHFRLTFMAVKLNATPYELKYWKGAKDLRSVEPYVHLSGSQIKKFADKIT